ncbi:M14 family zinc carboxypeptidase [Bdellovibrio sp. HCB337]|uniref:M14 family zinc carboxypeptidase n=1 Tax=Bdellovibrio sp. HCB337 TaxID=3394358 RepID=UPI0039A40041
MISKLILSLFLMSSASAATSNYNKVVADLQKIAQSNPQNAQMFNLGMSNAGQMIVGLKIGSGPVADLVVGTHHGNEYGSTAVAMGAAESFAMDPIPGHTVYIIPVLNISGYNSKQREEQIGRGTIDPNRDYPGPCVTTKSHQSKATKLLADFILSKNIVSSATLHTYFPAVLYPFGFSTNDTETKDDSAFINISKAATVESRYEIGNSKELLYAADGAFEDYAYWKHGIWSLLFEMGGSHNPTPTQIKKMVADNVPGLRRFFEMAPKERSANHAFTGRCDHNVRKRGRTHLE